MLHCSYKHLFILALIIATRRISKASKKCLQNEGKMHLYSIIVSLSTFGKEFKYIEQMKNEGGIKLFIDILNKALIPTTHKTELESANVETMKEAHYFLHDLLINYFRKKEIKQVKNKHIKEIIIHPYMEYIFKHG
eukprot:549661_1